MKTNRFTIVLIGLFITLYSFALSNDNTNNPITMVSYEQGWVDDNGTLA